MSLSEDLRHELAGIAPERECDRLAELSGLAHTAGSLHLRGRGEIALHLDLASPAAARRAFSLLRELGVTSEIRTYQRRAFGRETRYQLHVEGEGRALEVLRDAGIGSSAFEPAAEARRRASLLSSCLSARGAARRSHAVGAALAASRGADRGPGGRRVRGGDRRAGRCRSARARQGRSRGRVCEGSGADRRRPGGRGGEGCRPGVRGASRDGRHEGASEPAGERGSREPRPHEQGRASPDQSGETTRAPRRPRAHYRRSWPRSLD